MYLELQKHLIYNAENAIYSENDNLVAAEAIFTLYNSLLDTRRLCDRLERKLEILMSERQYPKKFLKYMEDISEQECSQ